jgi:energy-coupling factor transporter ATP-binding protein EcfA2
LALSEGECGQLTGPNGCGKTRLLYLAAGLMEPQEGEVRWRGQPPGPGSVGMVFQNPDYQLLGRSPLEEGYLLAGSAAQAEPALAAVGLSNCRQTPFDSLSPGQRRRAAIGSVLASGAPLVLLDNPLADCGIQEARELWRGITWFAGEGQRTLLVTGPLPDETPPHRSWDLRQWQQ